MDPIGLPNIWNGEDCRVPVVLKDSGGTALTGKATTDVSVKYARQSHSTLQSFSPSAAQWIEMGLGLYHLIFPSSILVEAGILSYVVDTVATGNQSFCGLTRIEDRPMLQTQVQEISAAVLESQATGYDEGTIGDAIYEASQVRYEVRCVPSYNEETQRAVIAVWLNRSGQLVEDVTSCRVIIKKEGSTAFADLAGTVANLNDGFFILVSDPFTFEDDASYQVWASITVGAETYTSGWTFVSFN